MPLSLEIIDDSAKHAGHAGSARGAFRVVLVPTLSKGVRTSNGTDWSMQPSHRSWGGVHALSIIARAPDEIVNNRI